MVRLALAAMLAAGPAAAAVPVAVAPAVPADSSGLITPGVFDSLQKIQKAAKQWTSVNMRINTSGGAFIDVYEPWTRVSLNGGKSGPYYRFSGFAGQESLSFNASPFGRGGWSLYGAGVNVSLTPTGNGGYSAWGTVGNRAFNVSLDRFGDSFTVWGLPGANISLSGPKENLTAWGTIDTAQFDVKSLAVLGATVGMLVSAPAAAVR